MFGAAIVTFGTALPFGLVGAPAAFAAAAPGANLGGLSAADNYTTTANLSPGSITHVWLIILENKSYNSEFSGVNDDTYLWQTLPSQGVLLQNYYGTGHTSMDNYISIVSGQGPSYDVQSDCSNANTQFASNNAVTAAYDGPTAGTNGDMNGVYTGGLGGIVNAGPGGTSVGGDTQEWAYGQAVSAEGPNVPIGTTTTTNGCTYPTDVATLFDQFNQAGVTWKGYAQDLGGAQQIGSSYQSNTVPGRDLATECGAPGNPDEALANSVSNPTFLSGAEGYPVSSNIVSSTVTSATTTSLTDSSENFTSSLVGDEVIITGGAQAGEKGTVSAVTNSTTLAVTFSALPGAGSAVAPAAGSSYIVGLADTTSFTAASLVAGSGTGPDGQAYSANNPEYSDQYVAKHFPFAWFESLTGVGASGTSALTEPANGGTNCDANHIANLDDPQDGLVADLNANTVPNFSWITPDNCSDGHDASCKGNNLSGAFALNSDGTINLNDPIYTPSSTTGANCTPAGCANVPNYDPEATTPRNYTGGTYAADLFLAYYVPLIEKSQAFQHGLIDVTFDEGEPSFVYGGNTFNNIPTSGPNSATGPNVGLNLPASGVGTTGPSGTGPEDNNGAATSYPSTLTLAPQDTLTYGAPGTLAPGATSPEGADDIFADSAGESFYNSATQTVTNFWSEPTGPNSPLVADNQGNQVYYGPGYDLNIHRPHPCPSGATTDGSTTNCVVGEVTSGSFTSASTRADSSATGTTGSASVTDASIGATDVGREIVTATVGGTSVSAPSTAYDDAFMVNGAALPSGDAVYVGEVTQNGPAFPTSSGGSTLSGASFTMVDQNGNSVTPTGAIAGITLSGECDPAVGSAQGELGGTLVSTCSSTLTPDPQFDATDPTNGGGDTGSVLISPFITPGTVSTVAYDHYSWLRTMEDLFNVNSCQGSNNVTLTAGSVCGGLDSLGHLGYAAQTNLADFGSDVFSNPSGPPSALPESPLAIGLPAAGILVLAGLLFLRRRQSSGAVA